jgi:hypothetical protein
MGPRAIQDVLEKRNGAKIHTPFWLENFKERDKGIHEKII